MKAIIKQADINLVSETHHWDAIIDDLEIEWEFDINYKNDRAEINCRVTNIDKDIVQTVAGEIDIRDFDYDYDYTCMCNHIYKLNEVFINDIKKVIQFEFIS